MPRLPRRNCGQALRRVDVDGGLGRAGAEDRLAVVLDHGQLADVDAAEDAHGDLAGEGLGHRAGWGWTGTPLSFSATAWP